MIRFECDYTEGAIPEIIERMAATNLDQTPGYGLDEHCERARALIREACGLPDADVQFVSGGTQANLTVISSVLRPWQGVIAAETGHVNGHECGAIEATGHKVLTLPPKEAKLSASQVYRMLKEHWDDPIREHSLQPGMVYISQPTECGTLYTLQELKELAAVCRKFDVCLYIDGARLGYGLASEINDVSLEDIAQLADIFYIGGTKVGALFGEAIVFANPKYAEDFRYNIKQRGGMLAKGRMLGIQFETLFEKDRYMRISRHADEMAMKLRRAFENKGYELFMESWTNQQFVIMDNVKLASLSENFSFLNWGPVDDTHSAARFVTSWATREEDVDALIDAL